MTPRPLLVAGGDVVHGAERRPADVLVRDGRVEEVGPDLTPDGAHDLLDAEGLLVAPGFLDLQCNGAHGIDLASEPERLWEVAAWLPRYGVTAWLPTVITSPTATVGRAIAALAEPPPEGVAAPLGLHLEGPMLAPSKRGAHPPDQLRLPDPALYETWTCDEGVTLVTLAPELPGALEAVRTLAAHGVVVAAGHTAAAAEDLAVAAEAGVTAVTHLGNATSGFDHRRPGVVGATLAHPALVAGIIVDGVHLHPTTVAAYWRALGPERTLLVSDAVAALGLPPGRARLGPVDVAVTERDVRLADGTLAGSNLSLDRAVRNLVAFTRCSVEDAVATVTTTPARLLGLRTKGAVAAGRDADLTILTADLHVVATVVAGVVVHDPSGRLLRTSC
jgi:N-acetylglucosamine-6-phosphate deacetylase